MVSLALSVVANHYQVHWLFFYIAALLTLIIGLAPSNFDLSKMKPRKTKNLFNTEFRLNKDSQIIIFMVIFGWIIVISLTILIQAQ